MAEEAKDLKKDLESRENVTVNLKVDPNDPRRNVPATPNLSKLNEEDPEKKPEFQNPV